MENKVREKQRVASLFSEKNDNNLRKHQLSMIKGLE